jgi:hypothetical protein
MGIATKSSTLGGVAELSELAANLCLDASFNKGFNIFFR